MTEAEIRAVIDVRALPQWQASIDRVKGGFKYLESRLTDNCAAPYQCKEQHQEMGLLRALDPSFAKDVDSAWIRSLSAMICFAHIREDLADQLEQELHVYQANAAAFTVDRGDIANFSTK
eukprot:scaffold236692_cov41-Tisochrysis_lutea.AAC.1